MYRLLGFVVGSGVSILLIVLFVGMPEFHLDDDLDVNRRYEEAIRRLQEKRHSDDAIDIAAIPEYADTMEVSVPETTDEAPSDAPAYPDPVADDAPVSVAATVAAGAADAEPAWQAIWNPFRSRVAAEGFVHRLEKVTGLDYRVVKVRSGVYQAAFAYSDDAERVARLAQISAATGLDLGDGSR